MTDVFKDTPWKSVEEYHALAIEYKKWGKELKDFLIEKEKEERVDIGIPKIQRKKK